MPSIKKIILNTVAVISFAFIAIVILFVGYEGLLYYAHDFDSNYALIDRCVTLGGEWNYDNETCLKETIDAVAQP